MKKTYIKPEMEMETIELESMIAMSALSIGEGKAKTAIDDNFTGPLMEGKDRDNSDWGGLW